MAKKETWVNTAKGMRWFKAYLPNGEVTDKIVRGGQKFMLTAEERRLNQQLSVEGLDLFKNGDFVLETSTEETVEEEVESDLAFSDARIAEILDEVEVGDAKLSEVLADIENRSTLTRFVEAAEERELHQAKYRWVQKKLDDQKAERDQQLVTSKQTFDVVNTPRTAGTESAEALGKI